MSGVEAPPLAADQATDVLNSVKELLRVTLTSPTRTEPGQPVTAALVPASPEIDVSQLAAGVLNLGLLTKNVVHTNKNVLDVPGSGDLDGDHLASTAPLAGGQPFPLPVALPASTAAVTQSNIPGLLGQVFGTISVPRLKVRLELRWILRDQQGNELKDEDGAFVAPQGLTSPNVSLIIPPLFEEWRADTVKNPPTTVFCLSAKVTLTLSPAPPVTFEVGPVPVAVLPLLIPTVVVLCSEPNFGINTGQQLHDGDVTDDHIQEEDNVGLSSALVVVPEHSPFTSAGALFKALRKVETAVDALSGIADFLGFFLPLGDLLSIPEQPRLRFSVARPVPGADGNLHTGIPKFSRIILKPKTFFFLTYDHDTFDDKVFSILVVGLPGTKVEFFSDTGFDKQSDQGFYTLLVGPELFVAVPTLDTSVDDPPVTVPPGQALPLDGVTGRNDTSDDNDGLWHTDMSSMAFADDWLADVQEKIKNPPPKPQLVCAPIRQTVRADLAIQARVEREYEVFVENKGPHGATDVRVEIEGSRVSFGGANASQGSVSGSGDRMTWKLGALAAGASAKASLAVKTHGNFGIKATVHANEADPDTSNNVATVSVIG
jgi:hypothetical protein